MSHTVTKKMHFAYAQSKHCYIQVLTIFLYIKKLQKMLKLFLNKEICEDCGSQFAGKKALKHHKERMHYGVRYLETGFAEPGTSKLRSLDLDIHYEHF